MNKRFLFNILSFCIFFTSCTLPIDNIVKYKKEIVSNEEKIEEKRLWSLLIYMAADNDLEYAAIEDIYEMECSKLNTEKVAVFILLDRSKAYDASNNNWAGTKLYRLKTGKKLETKGIISKEIECSNLGLKIGESVDLDMSSGYVLSEALSYINKEFPAENLGFIMWGHGTGWRSYPSNIQSEKNYKGFAYDDTSSSYMTLKQFGNALKKGLNGNRLSFLGLDTCFSGEIEVMYELRNLTKYAVGTEGLLLMSGWNYKNIFDDFEDDKLKTPFNLTKNILDNFSKEYLLSTGAAIVGIDMDFMDKYFNAFDEVMKHVALNINTRHERDTISNILLSKNDMKTLSYSYGKQNSDLYLDINSIFNNFSSIYSKNEEIKKNIESFHNVNDKCVIGNWSSTGNGAGLGVYYGTLTAGNLISSVHPDLYIKGKIYQQIQFVVDSKGYVPAINNNNNLLGKLFYTSFDK